MWKTLQWLLWTVGILSLGYWVEANLKGILSQSRGARELEHYSALPSSSSPSSQAPAAGEVVGRLEIPRLKLSTIVFEGADDDALERGAGHLPGTALPGGRGNTVLAAHRDTFFRPLSGIRKGDTVLVTTPDGVHSYRVFGTRVVAPSDVSVLRSGQRSQLTLVTCYPFDYVGSAPQRFIVQAELTPPRIAASQ